MAANHPFADTVFSHRYTHSLPADPTLGNFTREVHGAAYSKVLPTPVKNPAALAWTPELIEELGLEAEAQEHPELVQILSGNAITQGMTPYASCYGGHQFGQWAGQLGDGRAINLGEIKTRRGEHLTLQLKGAGRTPYSRSADGRAVLRSSLREFVASEAMHHLGIPTTRAMSLLTTGEKITRDILYNGNPRQEPGAIVSRIAPTFTRFGHFELPASRRDISLLKQLVDFSISCEYETFGFSKDPAGYGQWFMEVSRKTAYLIAEWQRVGFVHGVMNTDNLSIAGLTIDYGPFGWLDHFDPEWTPNITDAAGRRYAFSAQPEIARWNLVRLANAIYPLIGSPGPLEQGIEVYENDFKNHWDRAMSRKLGIRIDSKKEADQQFVRELWDLLAERETDFTLFFRELSLWPREISPHKSLDIPEFFKAAWYESPEIGTSFEQRIVLWSREYLDRMTREGRASTLRNQERLAANPRFIFRNYLAQTVLEQIDEGDTQALHTLIEALKKPYEEQPEREHLARRRPDWAKNRVGCSMLSCSS